MFVRLESDLLSKTMIFAASNENRIEFQHKGSLARTY